MELLGEFRPGYGQSVKFYRRAETRWVYWERWEWRTPEPPERRVFVAGWLSPLGIVVGIATALAAVAASRRHTDELRWIHADAGWCDPYTFEQSFAISS